jgi:predicted small integral membrane protein
MVLSAGAISALVLEVIKRLIRKYKNDEGFNFSSNFYLVAIPVLNILAVPLLALMGVAGYSMPTDWVGYVRGLSVVIVSSLISVMCYEGGIKPLKEYTKALTK